MVLSELAQVERVSRDEFTRMGTQAIIAADKPLLIDWCDPGPEDQVAARVIEGLGETPVALFRKSADPATKSRSTVVKIRIAEFFENPAFRTSDDGYVHRVVTNIKTNSALVEALLGESPVPYFDFSSKRDYVNLWINYRGQFGRAHFDELENFNLQLTGVKRFILAPPNRTNYYVRSLLKGFGHHSAFPDLLTVDTDRYPRFQQEIPKLSEAHVNPGQMLYIPIGWWHQVHPLGSLNINMNFWLFDRKLLRRPYVFFDAVYKEYFRKLLGRYDYQPEQPAAS